MVQIMGQMVTKGPIDRQLGRLPCCQLAMLKEMLSICGEVGGYVEATVEVKPNNFDIWWAELNVGDHVEASVWKLTTRLSTSVENLLNSLLHIALYVNWNLN